ncbi:ABC transporter ATP-binding protein [Chitinophagaceae bacterium IBVUCB1]|nr:ABC transporter ATP-binding protein [Chitinophagaceae bacterium IBVUCB1]
MSIIRVSNLVKKYGDFTAVKGISFEVKEGEIFGLLGPNGAGKTTTLEIIETLRPKTSGEVWVKGLNLDKDANEIKKIIGVQLQAAGYYPNLNLLQIIDLFAGLYNRSVDALALLDTVNLRDKAKNKFKELSGGQKQRFSIATTLINEPSIIFLDEPTTGLDPQARRNLWELIKQVRDRGTTVVITTHYMDEAEVLCDRVAIVDSGAIIALNTPDELIDNLIATGFKRTKQVKEANLEDVFLNLTGKEWREE